MNEFVRKFKKKDLPQIKKYLAYIKANDWSTPITERNKSGAITSTKYYFVKDIKEKGRVVEQGKEPEYNVQQKIVDNVLNRLKHFCGHVESDIGKDKTVDNAIKKFTELIDYHIKRTDDYISKSVFLDDKEEVEGVDVDAKQMQSEEIEFDNKLYKNQTKVQDAINSLDLKRENKEGILELYSGQKAPLAMREVIEKEYPEVKKIVDSIGIDFDSPPKNEMLIHIQNPPVWNEDKHYFEQEKKTLQFYVDEFKKLRRGITIGGVYITPWMYTHLNIFKTDIPISIKDPHTDTYTTKDQLMNPPLRDNEWFIIQDSYQKAKSLGEILFLCATRRAAKTTLIASLLQHKSLELGGELIVAGGSTKDLGQIQKNFEKTSRNVHPAFALPIISNDWTKKVRLGVKKKNQKNISDCFLAIVNLDSGGEKASEVLAGFTPNVFVLDECMKSPFLDQLNAAKPSFDAPTGKRLVPILSGTGSANDALTRDAYKMLKDPSTFEVHQMDYDELERNIPKHLITWKRRKFGTYIPAQMSAKVGMVKKEIPLAEYLGIPSTLALDKIKIKVTQWEKALEIIKEDRRKKEKDKASLTKEKVYYPIDPEEIFLSGKDNPFPKEEIRRFRDKLIEEGDIGKNVVLYYDEHSQKVAYTLSEKEVPDFPFNGGFHDSPVTIYQDPPPDVMFEFCVSSVDDYKQEQADSDSVGSFVVIRRDTKEVVASYHSRPDPHNKFHEQGMLLLEMYNSPVFMENADMGFKEYMDRLERTDEYIVKAIDFLGDISLDGNKRRKYGWTPTPNNKSYLLGILINITKQQTPYEDDFGKTRTRWGFEKIKDIRILDEMINYQEGGNFDGITALMGAYGYDYYLTANYGAPKQPLTQKEQELLERKREEMRKRRANRTIFPKSRRKGRYW